MLGQMLDYFQNISRRQTDLYKIWGHTCPDQPKSSVEDLDGCQDLAEEHYAGNGVKCVVEGI